MMNGVFIVTAGYDNKIVFWEPGMERAYRAVKHPDSQVNDLKITRSREFIAAAGASHISFYETDSRNGNAVISFQGHTANVNEIGFDHSGSWMYSCSDDKTVKIWDMRTNNAQREYRLLVEPQSIVLHPNQTDLLIGCNDGSIRVIDLIGDRVSANLDRPIRRKFQDLIRSISVSPNGEYVTSIGREGTAYNLSIEGNDAATIHHVNQFEAHPNHFVTKCMYSNGGKYLATASSDSTIKIWDPSENWSLKHTLYGHEKWVWDVRFSNDDKYLLSGSSDTTAILWELSSGVKIRKYQGHKGTISAVELDDNVPVSEIVEEEDLLPFSILP
eukprot:TRINITY_DN7122_c0_g1_i1.p1 TRINITY_DN7122_c0_g1~~TRINITY_DN7122_c0_g1_i1.p1  ORF type:complete len:329 (-),score=47.02 TRINITY_DN7122_c0_g1_i1:52-1038(-)